jgi:hypothetical protein
MLLVDSCFSEFSEGILDDGVLIMYKRRQPAMKGQETRKSMIVVTILMSRMTLIMLCRRIIGLPLCMQEQRVRL